MLNLLERGKVQNEFFFCKWLFIQKLFQMPSKEVFSGEIHSEV